MRLNIRLMGVLVGSLVLAIIGRKVLVYGPRGRDNRGAAAILMGAVGAELAMNPSTVVAQVATPSPGDYARADAILEHLPEGQRALAARRDAVMPLLLGLLLSDDPRLARDQALEIGARLGAGVADAATRLRDGELAGLHPILRLPLASLAFPVLRLRPRPELDAFVDTVHAVVHSDGEVSLFEYCLGKLLQVQVVDSLEPGRHASFGRRKLTDVSREVATLLCIVAQSGHADPAQARRAYLAGIQRVLPREHLPFLERSGGVAALDPVWSALDALDPLARQALVEGITATIAHDNRVTVAEAELLRTLCGVLRCPLPPSLSGA
jgi:hypothetical protein